MCTFIADNWDKIIGFAIAIIGIVTYFDSRKRELKWKRTEYLFSEAKYMDTDEDMICAIKIIENRHKEVKIDDVFDCSGLPRNTEYGDIWHKIDKVLNLLDRIAYAVIHLKTLTTYEANNFGWYLSLITQNEHLRKYCEENGFDDVLELAKRVDQI